MLICLTLGRHGVKLEGPTIKTPTFVSLAPNALATSIWGISTFGVGSGRTVAGETAAQLRNPQAVHCLRANVQVK